MTEPVERRRMPLRRWVGCGVILALALLFAGILITFIDRSRALAAKVACQNNLRALALLGTPYTRGDDGVTRPSKDAKQADSVWPGTVFNAELKADERLSWVVFALPQMVEPAANVTNLNVGIDRKAAWNVGSNLEASRTVLRSLQCPGWPMLPAPNEPAVTMVVGIAGIGPDAASLPLTVTNLPKTGAFRYDTPTPLVTISAGDGISNTLLFGVTRHENGPWLQGGFCTVRGLMDGPGAKLLIGPGGQFGGTLNGGTWFALCDGSVRWFSDRTRTEILLAMATIAGGKNELPQDN